MRFLKNSHMLLCGELFGAPYKMSWPAPSPTLQGQIPWQTSTNWPLCWESQQRGQLDH